MKGEKISNEGNNTYNEMNMQNNETCSGNHQRVLRSNN